MARWNLADCLDRIAAIRGDEEALVQGERSVSWRQLERRARNLAAWMREQGASHQGKVAIYTYNHPAYMEGVYAAFKAAMVPVNVNYRYREEELRYLLDNADDAPETRSERMFAGLEPGFAGTDPATGRRRGLKTAIAAVRGWRHDKRAMKQTSQRKANDDLAA